jgi:streptomycin 6-kinase
MTAELGLDRDRARWWTAAQTLAWSSDDGAVHDHAVAVARHLLAA